MSFPCKISMDIKKIKDSNRFKISITIYRKKIKIVERLEI